MQTETTLAGLIQSVLYYWCDNPLEEVKTYHTKPRETPLEEVITCHAELSENPLEEVWTCHIEPSLKENDFKSTSSGEMGTVLPNENNMIEINNKINFIVTNEKTGSSNNHRVGSTANFLEIQPINVTKNTLIRYTEDGNCSQESCSDINTDFLELKAENEMYHEEKGIQCNKDSNLMNHDTYDLDSDDDVPENMNCINLSTCDTQQISILSNEGRHCNENTDLRQTKLVEEKCSKFSKHVEEIRSESPKLVEEIRSESPKLVEATRSELPKLVEATRSESPKHVEATRSESPKLVEATRSESPKLVEEIRSELLKLESPADSEEEVAGIFSEAPRADSFKTGNSKTLRARLEFSKETIKPIEKSTDIKADKTLESAENLLNKGKKVRNIKADLMEELDENLLMVTLNFSTNQIFCRQFHTFLNIYFLCRCSYAYILLIFFISLTCYVGIEKYQSSYKYRQDYGKN